MTTIHLRIDVYLELGCVSEDTEKWTDAEICF